MDKVIVIGCSGSGKSVFSRKLRDVTHLPLYHIDRIYWREDGSFLSKPELHERLREIINEDRWILDGNYGSTMEMRMKAADTVFFLDYPTEICLAGVRERKGKPRSDMAWLSPDDDDMEFVEFIKNYNRVNRPRVMELLEKYSHKRIVVFKSREESECYLRSLRI